MTTPDAPDAPDTPGTPDARDRRVAAWLEVEPLDEVTRSRLVRHAIAAASESASTREATPARLRRARVLAVAAAFVAVVVVGIGVLVSGGDDTTAPTASDAPAAQRAPDDAGAPRADQERALAESAPSPLPDLGALGDVSTPRLLRAAVGTSRAATTSAGSIAPPACALEAGRALGTPVAAGTGTVDGGPATVIVVERPDHRRSAVAVLDGPCEAGPSVTLP